MCGFRSNLDFIFTKLLYTQKVRWPQYNCRTSFKNYHKLEDVRIVSVDNYREHSEGMGKVLFLQVSVCLLTFREGTPIHLTGGYFHPAN